MLMLFLPKAKSDVVSSAAISDGPVARARLSPSPPSLVRLVKTPAISPSLPDS